MMQKPWIKRNKQAIGLILWAVMIMSCSNPNPSPAGTPSEPPSTKIVVSPSVIPSATLVSSSTPSPSDTPTMVPTSTWTPLPTYSAQQVDTKIKELLETNGGCQLPCWWGIVPNKTSWPEASHFLNPLLVDVGQGTSATYSKDGEQHIATNFSVYFEVPNISKQGRILFSVQDDIVIGMSVYPPVGENQYRLHDLMALLGPPNQVLINAQSTSPVSELPPAVLTLDYSDIGVWASYGYIPSLDGNSLLICPKSIEESKSIYNYENLGVGLELFDPDYEYDQMLSIEEYAEMVGGFTPKKLEEVTDMTIESFYNTFIQPKSETCIETPADLWP